MWSCQKKVYVFVIVTVPLIRKYFSFPSWDCFPDYSFSFTYKRDCFILRIAVLFPSFFPLFGSPSMHFGGWAALCGSELITEASGPPGVVLGKGVLKICSKFTGEHPCRNVISIKLQSISIEIPLLHWYPLVNLLYIIRTPFHKNTSGELLVSLEAKTSLCKSLIRQLYFYRLMVMLVPLQLWYYELIVRILYSDWKCQENRAIWQKAVIKTYFRSSSFSSTVSVPES